MKIYLNPDEVWDYYIEHYGETDMTMIAENEEFGVEIYLEFDADYPCISVMIDNDQPIYEMVENEEACAEFVKSIYETYLVDNVMDLIEGLEEIREDCEKTIREREEELDDIVSVFVADVMQDYQVDIDPDVIQDLKEHFLMYMYRKHGIDPYRPMLLKDGKGGEDYEEYPYERLSK